MKRSIIKLVLISLILTTALSAVEIPKLKGRINDLTGVLNGAQTRGLENRLMNLEQQSGAQMAVLIIPTLAGENLEDWSMRVVEKWQLGEKGKDNGVLLLISMRDRKIRIETGYGLEGSLTDAKAAYIIRNVIAPDFRRKNYYKGISKGVDLISGIIMKTADISPKKLRKKKKNTSHFSVSLIIFIIFVLISMFKGGGRRGGYRRGGTAVFWGGSGYSSSSSSGGGFSGFSGGGGSFGGGGASGGW